MDVSNPSVGLWGCGREGGEGEILLQTLNYFLLLFAIKYI
jgi:hypothetical protein